ncbi:GXWXG domain-containing protein [Barrientosiimonas endolithica]
MQAHDVLPHVPADAGDALALFDGLAALEPAALRGTWRGAEVPTGHPMDGLLALTGWWGSASSTPSGSIRCCSRAGTAGRCGR